MSVPRQVYFDNNATTRVAPEVLEVMLPFFKDLYGNASSMHHFGGQVARHLQKAREEVAALLNAEPSEIIFTSCGTESNNTAIRGVLEAQPDRKHIVTTKVEHPAVLNVCRWLAKTKGYRVTELNVDGQGNLNMEEVRAALTADTAIVSIMAANNETGTMFPIEEIAALAHERGITFHTDGVQAVGKLPIDLKKAPFDLVSLSGHKLHAPKGIGVLFVRRGTLIQPWMLGGHQERSRRGGTENVPYIVGLGKACSMAREAFIEETTRVRSMRDRLEKGLLERVPHVHINGNPQWRLPNTTNLGFEFIEGEAILLHLSAAGIAASSGSACTSGSLEPSHVLMAMNIPFTYAHGSVRLSLSRYSTEEDVDYVIQVMPGIVQKLREMSPFYNKARHEAATS